MDVTKSKLFWHFLYTRRRRYLAKTTKEILAGQIVSLVGAIAAGYILESVKETLAATVGVFLMLPGILELGGAVAGAYAAKIHHKSEELKKINGHVSGLKKIFFENFVFSYAVLIFASIILGIFAGTLTVIFFQGEFLKIFILTVIACLTAALIGLPLVGLAGIFLTKKGYNADNFIGPIETSLFDALTITSVYLILRLILR